MRWKEFFIDAFSDIYGDNNVIERRILDLEIVEIFAGESWKQASPDDRKFSIRFKSKIVRDTTDGASIPQEITRLIVRDTTDGAWIPQKITLCDPSSLVKIENLKKIKENLIKIEKIMGLQHRTIPRHSIDCHDPKYYKEGL